MCAEEVRLILFMDATLRMKYEMPHGFESLEAVLINYSCQQGLALSMTSY